MARRSRKPRQRQTTPETEEEMQNAIYRWSRSKDHEVAISNTGVLFGVETDFVSMTSSDLFHAFEIKVSRNDWLAEIRTIAKEHGSRRKPSKKQRAEQLSDAAALAEKAGKRSNARLQPPNYFWIAIPDPMIVREDEIPAYAGVMVFREGRVEILKKAPRLHRNRATGHQVAALMRGLSLRYWEPRVKTPRKRKGRSKTRETETEDA